MTDWKLIDNADTDSGNSATKGGFSLVEPVRTYIHPHETSQSN